MDWILLVVIVALLLLATLIDNTRSGRARILRRFSRNFPLPLTDAATAAIPRRLWPKLTAQVSEGKIA